MQKRWEKNRTTIAKYERKKWRRSDGGRRETLAAGGGGVGWEGDAKLESHGMKEKKMRGRTATCTKTTRTIRYQIPRHLILLMSACEMQRSVLYVSERKVNITSFGHDQFDFVQGTSLGMAT